MGKAAKTPIKLRLTWEELEEMRAHHPEDLKEYFEEAVLGMHGLGLMSSEQAKEILNNMDYYLTALEEQ